MWRYSVIYNDGVVVGTFEGEGKHFEELFDSFKKDGHTVVGVSRDTYYKEKREKISVNFMIGYEWIADLVEKGLVNYEKKLRN